MVGTNNNNHKQWHRGGGDSKYRAKSHPGCGQMN